MVDIGIEQQLYGSFCMAGATLFGTLATNFRTLGEALTGRPDRKQDR